MAGRRVLVDGYNVIRSDPDLSRLEGQSMEAAREALVRTLAASNRFLGDSVTVFFDGPRSRPFPSEQRLGTVRSVYSTGGSSADDLIRAQAAAGQASNIVVVTDDREIGDYCKSLGCTVTGSRNLLSQVFVPPRIRPRPDRQTPPERASLESGSARKKGNPRRAPKRGKVPPEYRF